MICTVCKCTVRGRPTTSGVCRECQSKAQTSHEPVPWVAAPEIAASEAPAAPAKAAPKTDWEKALANASTHGFGPK